MIIVFGHISLNIQTELTQPLTLEKENNAKTGITDIGGHAAIQAIAAARAGAKVSLCGTIGNDVFGKTILDTLRREGINATSIAKNEASQTGQTITIHTKNTQPLIITIQGANKYTNATQIPDNIFNERTIVLLQNDMPDAINTIITSRAQSKGAKVLLAITNTDQECPELSEKVDMIIDKDPQNKSGFNCFCGTLAACLQAGMNQTQAQKFAQAAGRMAAEKGGGYSALPYLDDLEKKLEVKD